MGGENVIAGYLLRLTNELSINTIPINDSFPNEFLFSIHNVPQYANIVNYFTTGKMSSNLNFQDNKKFLIEVKSFYKDDPFLFKYYTDQIFYRQMSDDKVNSVVKF